MHTHHSTIRLAIGFATLVLLGLAGYFLVDIFSAPPKAAAPAVSPFTHKNQTPPAAANAHAGASPFDGALVPGLESNSPPPGH